MITHDRLKELVHYNPDTGVFTHRDHSRLFGKDAARKRERAGTLHPSGSGKMYLRVGLDGKFYTLHRLAWFYMTGEWPKEIDHVNCDATDNRWANLRECEHIHNTWNRKTPKTNTSGVKGVNMNAKGKWTARIGYRGQRFFLGQHDTLEQAKKAREDAAKRLHGEFYRSD